MFNNKRIEDLEKRVATLEETAQPKEKFVPTGCTDGVVTVGTGLNVECGSKGDC
jgi:hypothetical protein